MRTLIAAGLLGAALTAAPTLTAQNPGARPTYGDVRLDGGFLPDPHRLQLTAGGSTRVSVSGCAYGFVADAPDVDLYYSGNGQRTLYFYATSDEDTTLLINLPDGSWVCNDDGLGGRNPLVVIRNAPSGLYDIWVGTYGSTMVRATLNISEIAPN